MNSQFVEKISLWQLASFVILYEMGSAIILRIATEANQDAWIAVFIATFLSLGIFYCYYEILNKQPGKNLFEIIGFCFGRPIAIVFSFIYVIYFFHISTFVIRDFGELLVSSVFPKTPLEFIVIILYFVIIYIVNLGIEVLARSSEIFLPYIIVLIFAIPIGILLSGQFRITNAQPILGDGLTPIIKAIFPNLIHFPFAEIVVFMCIIPYVTKFQYAKRVGLAALLTSGLFLTISVFIQIVALGAELRARTNFPFFLAARQISLFNFIERIDLLVVFIMLISIIVQSSILFFGGLKGLEYIFKLPYRTFIIPIGCIIPLNVIYFGKNTADFLFESKNIVPYVFHNPLNFYFPGLLLIILMWKTRNNSKGVSQQ